MTCSTIVRDVLGALWRLEMPRPQRRNWLCHECADEIANAEFAVCDKCGEAEPLTSVLARKPATVAKVKRTVSKMRRR